MAFRIKAKTCAGVVLLTVCALAASPQNYEVTHKHLRHSGLGVLRIDETGISFDEAGKHSRVWKYEDIQQLVLGPETLQILSYEDNRWQLGRDRIYVFDRVPARLAIDWYPVLRAKLDARFVAALADDQAVSDWQLPVKLIHGRSGSNGVLLVGADSIVYKSAAPAESRTWRIADIENASTSDPFDLTLTTREATFRFQLKQSLPADRFQELWMRVNQTRGLRILTR